MTISTIRPYTAADEAAIEHSAIRFCGRHNIEIEIDQDFSAQDTLDYHLDMVEEDSRLRKLWQRCLCRALGVDYDSRVTIAYGHIGYRID